jgi:hypothetical protein
MDIRWACVLVAALIAAGCPEPVNPPAPPPPAPAPPSPPSRPAFNGQRVGPLLGRLVVGPDHWISQMGPAPPPVAGIARPPSPQVSEVYVTVELFNGTDGSMSADRLGVAGGSLFTVEIADAAGRTVFTHTEPAGSAVWSVDEVRRFELTWPVRRPGRQLVSTGEYSIIVTFAFGGRLTASTILR